MNEVLDEKSLYQMNTMDMVSVQDGKMTRHFLFGLRGLQPLLPQLFQPQTVPSERHSIINFGRMSRIASVAPELRWSTSSLGQSIDLELTQACVDLMSS